MQFQKNSKQLRVLLSTGLALVCSALTGHGADISYAGTGNNDRWDNSANWNGGTIPNDSATGAAFNQAGTQVILDASTSALSRGFMLGMYGATNSGTVEGGTLDCTWLDVGRCDQNGGNGMLTVSGGQITVSGALNIPTQFSTQVDPNDIGQGHLNLFGGIISATTLHIGNGQTGENGGVGTLHITDGTLILQGDRTTQIQDYITQGRITTTAPALIEIDYNTTNLGQTTVTAGVVVISYDEIADRPYPQDGLQTCHTISALSWKSTNGADTLQIYFGTTPNPPLVATVGGGTTSYQLPALNPETPYYWRVDATQGGLTNAGPLWSFTTRGANECPDIAPPWNDYCVFLQQEIQGKKHGFLAGNKTNYIGGFMPVWNQQEDETIGFTHPFHNDLRSRGHGMVNQTETGYGHDLTGWEFYKATKVAYGTVIINGTRYENPVPTAMYWRPDRMICEYLVGGVNIREDKFIALNDAACSIITSDAPVTLEFVGQSFYRAGKTVSTTATCTFDVANNAVHVVDGGVNLVKPYQEEVYEGVMMYDGMSTILSASKPLQNYTNTTEATGQQKYSFTVPCDSNGLSLVWSMNDDGATAIAEAQSVLADSSAALQAKTDHMNDLLNNQIPYFRCSDNDIVQIYYYLWAIYLMYYIDVDEGFEQYPHTQSAVNNFLGAHRYDANIQIPVGAWTADKEYYANGNVLLWKAMLPYADLTTGRIPADNIGKAWYSGLSGGVTGHVIGAWQIYEHSRDEAFLAEAYDFYRALMWNTIPGFWGHQYEAADCLGKMALELGYPQSEANHWQGVVNSANFDNWFDSLWEKNGVEHYFGAGNSNKLAWTTFAYLNLEDFPQDLAREMIETWALDDVVGFNRQGQMGTTDLVWWQELINTGGNTNFMITPDTNFFALQGMYRSGVYDHANSLTLAHLKNYNMKWGIPCAPEAVSADYEFHGDQYSNFNAGKILNILEGICGLSYSVVDSSFTVADNLPQEWTFMETYIPIKEGNQNYWTRVKIDRSEAGGILTKELEIENNRLLNLNIEPWLEGFSVLEAPANYVSTAESSHIAYQFQNQIDLSLELKLADPNEVDILRRSFSVAPSPDDNPDEVCIQFGIGSPPVSASAVVLERSVSLEPNDFEEVYRYEIMGNTEVLGTDIRSDAMPYYFTIFDQMMPAGRAFYRVRVLE
jgi:hypothetical protein